MKVMYATDGLPAAEQAGQVIERLFRRDIALTVATVTHAWSLDPDHLKIQLEPIVERRGDSAQIVDAAALKLSEAGFKPKKKVLEGHPGHELVQAAAAADVLVLGAGSHSWLSNRLLGSVSTYALHSAPCSVLIVHQDLDADRARVLVGVDGSHTADMTVGALADLLDPQRCDVAVMSVVQVSTPALVPVFMGPPVFSERDQTREVAALTDHANGTVARSVGALRDCGFTVTSSVERGGAATVLLQEAHQGGFGLLATGSRGLGPIRRTLLGSVSDQIARLSSAAFIGRFLLGPDDLDRLVGS